MELRIFDISSFTDSGISAALSLLPDERREELIPRLHTAGAKLSLAGEMLARQMLSKRLSMPQESFIIKKTPLGKPYAEGVSVYFNISHSGNFAVCVIDTKPVGVDIQSIAPPMVGVMRRSFSEAEREYILAEPEYGAERFTRLWCMKEAFAKRLGGSVFSRDVFLCRFEHGKPVLDYGGFSFLFPSAPSGFVISVCL